MAPRSRRRPPAPTKAKLQAGISATHPSVNGPPPRGRDGTAEPARPTRPSNRRRRLRTDEDVLVHLLGGPVTVVGTYFGAEFVALTADLPPSDLALGPVMHRWLKSAPGGVVSAIDLCALRGGLRLVSAKTPTERWPSRTESQWMERAAATLRSAARGYLDLLDSVPDNVVKSRLQQFIVPSVVELHRELHLSSVLHGRIAVALSRLWDLERPTEPVARRQGRPATTQRFVGACRRAGLTSAEQMAQVYALESSAKGTMRIGKPPAAGDLAWRRIKLAEATIAKTMRPAPKKGRLPSREDYVRGDPEPD